MSNFIGEVPAKHKPKSAYASHRHEWMQITKVGKGSAVEFHACECGAERAIDLEVRVRSAFQGQYEYMEKGTDQSNN